MYTGKGLGFRIQGSRVGGSRVSGLGFSVYPLGAGTGGSQPIGSLKLRLERKRKVGKCGGGQERRKGGGW